MYVTYYFQRKNCQCLTHLKLIKPLSLDTNLKLKCNFLYKNYFKTDVNLKLHRK